MNLYIKYLFLLPLYLLSFLTYRSKKKWLYGSCFGFSSNSKYFFIFNNQRKNEIRHIWIGNNDEVDIIKTLGFEAYRRWSSKGIYHSLTAKIYIYSSYVDDINLFTSGSSKKVNLWHGVGIKNIEFKAQKSVLHSIKRYDIVKRIKYLRNFIKPDLFLSTSPLMTQHFSTCFQISKKNVIESMYPRCEIFFMKENELNDFIHTYESPEFISLIRNIHSYNYSYLYMPTWRDSDRNFLTNFFRDFTDLDEHLRSQNKIFIMKLHPMTKLDGDFSQLTNIKLLDSRLDIYPLFSAIDCLVTDYSSVYYDFLLLKKRTIFFVPDIKDYISKDRDLAFDFDESTSGEKIYSYQDFIFTISSDTKGYVESKKDKYIKTMFWGSRLDITSDYIYNNINRRLC